MRNLVSATLAAAAVMYIVSSAFWISPLPYQFLERVPDDSSASDALLESFPRPGVYMLPDLGEKPNQLPDLYDTGPIATIFIEPQGRPMMSLLRHTAGALNFLAIGLFLSFSLRETITSLTRVRQQLGVPILIGIAAALACDTTGPIWFYQDMRWHLVLGFYHFLMWCCASWTIVAILGKRESFLIKIRHYLQSSFINSRS
jgi:hypothetical protein